MRRWQWRLRWLPLVLAAWLLAACSSAPPAPVIERSTQPVRQEIPVDGLYRVRKGDSLHAIAFKYGLDYHDIAHWNSIRQPYLIYPDQVLRLRPPVTVAKRTVPAHPGASTGKPAAPKPASPTAAAPQPVPSDTAKAPVRIPSPAADPSAWRWPTQGRVLRGFRPGDPARNGLDIAGREGQSIVASAPGVVVYSGDGLIGYGELIIIKHNEALLSAYAHNRRRLVAEGEQVSGGQKIAELGRNGRDEAVLHFEIRRNGKPVDPAGYLPGQ